MYNSKLYLRPSVRPSPHNTVHSSNPSPIAYSLEKLSVSERGISLLSRWSSLSTGTKGPKANTHTCFPAIQCMWRWSMDVAELLWNPNLFTSKETKNNKKYGLGYFSLSRRSSRNLIRSESMNCCPKACIFCTNEKN